MRRLSCYPQVEMDQDQLRGLLESVRSGAVDIDAALDRMRHLPFEDLGFAKLDHHRALRHGLTEVIFGKGKTPRQVAGIAARLLEKSPNVLITRADESIAAGLKAQLPGGRVFSAFRRRAHLARPHHARQRQAGGGLRRHQRHSGGRRSAGHRRSDGQRGGSHLRHRRGRHPSADGHRANGWRKRASSWWPPEWKARCRAWSAGWYPSR